MSHFKVLVIGDNVEEQLEPYNENTELTPYRVEGFNDVEEVQKALEWDRDSRNTNPQGFEDPHDDLDKRLALLQDWRGGDMRINHEEGRVEEWSTYNPYRYGLIGDSHGTGSQEDNAARDKVLFEVQNDKAPGSVLEGLEDARWSIRVLPGLPEEEEQEQDSRAAQKVEPVVESRDNGRNVRSDITAARGRVCNMPEEERDAVRPVRGSLPFDGGDSGIALSEMQHGDRLHGGFSIRAAGRSELPEAPSGYHWELIGGSKWDYWAVGGRYNTTFKIKPDADVDDYTPSQPHWLEASGDESNHENASDRARKRAIDFKAMVDAALAQAHKDWDEVAEATVGIEPPTRSWTETLEAYGVDDIDAAREEWHSHPWNAAARKARYWDAYEHFHMGEDDPKAAFLDHQKKMSFAGFYAVVKDGKWSARGEMGWFGMSSDDIDHAQWLHQVSELINSLPDDTMLTVVDCHI